VAESTPRRYVSTAEEIAMFQGHSIRIATVVALGVLLAVCGGARAGQELKAGAAAALEVRVLQVQTPPDPAPGERYDVFYRMEVISVQRSTSRVKPGDTIVVRSYALNKEALDIGVSGPKAPALLAPGWIGLAYLNPDPKDSGPEARWRFTIAANGDSFENLPPAPPSLIYTR
jgi:hypothetical protein